jgi:hypothetical protein
MFTAKYTITNKILRSIGLIDASREVISNAPLIPAWEMKFRKDAITRQIHHGTRLEGNPLSEEQVQDVLDGKEVLARDRDIQEILPTPKKSRAKHNTSKKKSGKNRK